MTTKEKLGRLQTMATKVQALACILVRESGYNAAVLQATGHQGEDYSRAAYLYDEACELLRSIDWEPRLEWETTEDFIQATYAPYKQLPEWERANVIRDVREWARKNQLP